MTHRSKTIRNAEGPRTVGVGFCTWEDAVWESLGIGMEDVRDRFQDGLLDISGPEANARSQSFRTGPRQSENPSGGEKVL